VSIANTSNSTTNSTKTSKNSKSLLPLILRSTFGGLAVIVLIACIITYALTKQGYTNVFNQPQTQMKDIERKRMIDSTSSVGNASPSQR
jgi:hypothetical protein